MSRSYNDIKEEQIDQIIRREKEFEFPELLTLLRQTMGINRKAMAKDCNIPEFLLFNWEKGKFKRDIKQQHLLILADYYQVPFRFLLKKMRQFQGYSL